MKYKFVIILIFIIINYNIFAREKHDLNFYFIQAVKNSANFKINKEDIIQNEYKIKEKYTNFVPEVNLNSTYYRQPSPSNPIIAQQSPTEQKTTKVTLSQNIFKGFQDIYNLEMSENNYKISKFEKEKYIISVYNDLCQYYFNIASSEILISNYNEQIKSEEERKKDLLKQKKLGRIRESDIVTIDASIANLKSILENEKMNLEDSLATFSYITGIRVDKIELSDEDKRYIENNIDLYFLNMENIPDIKVQKENINNAETNIKISKSNYSPKLEFNANYYLQRPDIYSGINWDAQLSLTIPLSTNIVVYNQVSESVSKLSQEHIKYEDKVNEYKKNIKQYYAKFISHLKQKKLNENAFLLTTKSYNILLEDSKKGLATNSDVLKSLKDVYEAKINLDKNILNLFYYFKILNSTANPEEIINVYNQSKGAL